MQGSRLVVPTGCFGMGSYAKNVPGMPPGILEMVDIKSQQEVNRNR
ncbi:MAG: hypothetical protein KGZ94_01225 [Clostridia bacterium]|nr:hypothetical protein [Clostridia bacterium]